MAKKLNEGDHAKILAEARRRFKRCQDWESKARTHFVDDIKFNAGDSDNLFQWPEDVRTRMTENTRAMLTINKTHQHCLDILNDARQSRVSIKIRPTGGGSSVDSAEIYMGVIRHIEYISSASTAYQNGLSFAVRGGWGYWRLVTDYANDDSFDQEIFIRPVNDPLSVFLDPDIHQFDGSDAKFGFVYTEYDKEEFEVEFPEWKGRAADSSLGDNSWARNKVRIAEYFRRVQTKDRLFAYPDPADPTGKAMKTVRESELEPSLAKVLARQSTTTIRSIKSHKVEWFKIIGDNVTEEREWLGIYIPIIRCIGNETVIDGELDRPGHVRALKDPQRMFNYNASGSVEFGALQSKTPYTGPADAIEGYEEIWDTANTINHAYLPHNHRDDQGEEIPAPVRQQPPMAAPVFMDGMKDAAEWMRMVSGQYQSDMGAPSNERSGVAITARQRQGDNATFHFLDHESIAIRFTGKQLIDLIPKYYDTERVIKIMGEDGTTETEVTIDPQAKDALTQVRKTRDAVETIFNPRVGEYDVEADVGAAYATARQEAFNAFSQILSQNKELTSLIGDLALQAADFPGAEEAAKRLKRMVPQQALEDGPAPDVIALQKQIQQMSSLMQTLAGKLADKTAAHQNDAEKNAISGYDAQTKRLAAVKDYLQAAGPELLISLVTQIIQEAESTSAEGLSPALTPTPVLTGQQFLPPPAAPAGGGAPPPGPSGTAGGMPVNAEPGDMGSGPPSTPGAGSAPPPA